MPNQANAGLGNASLHDWLRNYLSGNGRMSGDQLEGLGGNSILAEMQKLDPNAQWVMMNGGGPAGEGGYEQAPEYMLDFDREKLPTVGGPGGNRSIFDTGYVPVDPNTQLGNPDLVYDDPTYGKLTMPQNVKPEKDPWWVHVAPLAVGMLAPWAAGGLAAAGIGGTAGLTAAATGSGLTGIGTLPQWATQLLTKAPNYAQSFSNGGFDFDKLLPTIVSMGGNAMGINPNLVKAGMTLAQLSRGRP